MEAIEVSKYRVSTPIVLNGVHDMTICGYSIKGGSASCIDLVNCNNIHITQCELSNSEKLGISLRQCTNVIIEDCQVDNVWGGVQSVNGYNVQVRNNAIRKIAPGGIMVKFENTNLELINIHNYSSDNDLPYHQHI